MWQFWHRFHKLDWRGSCYLGEKSNLHIILKVLERIFFWGKASNIKIHCFHGQQECSFRLSKNKKQSPDVFYERFLKILKDFVNLTGKQLRWSLFLKKFLINFIKKELQHSFLVKFAKFLKTLIVKNICELQLLKNIQLR